MNDVDVHTRFSRVGHYQVWAEDLGLILVALHLDDGTSSRGI